MNDARARQELVWVSMRHLVDNGSGGVFPAFVVGKELRNTGPRPLPLHARDPRRRYTQVTLDHQYGGYACLSTNLCGFVLPLHANLERSLAPDGAARRPAETLLEVLRRRAQSVAVEDRRHPALPLPVYPMHTGNEMTAQERCLVADAIATSFATPAPVHGWEALIDLGILDPEWADGWTSVTFGPDGDGYLRPVDRRRLRPEHLSALGGPRLWLLWENCD